MPSNNTIKTAPLQGELASEARLRGSLKGGVPEGEGGLLEHFKDLTLHPKNAEELKGLILQLAIQGKLTAQWRKDNPNVISGIKLLEEIVNQKAVLIKKNKVKKEKNPLLIDENDIPFSLPETWVWSRLVDISSINGGFAFKSSQYVETGIRVIRISDFNEAGFKDSKIVRYIYNDDLEQYRLEENNIIIAMTGGTVGKSYFIRELNEDMVTNQRVATIKLMKAANAEYVNCVIPTKLVQDVIEEAKNSTNDNISMSDIKGFFVPIPPLEEQKAIVATVNQLFAEVEQLEDLTKERIQTKEDFVTSALRELSTQDTNNAWAFLQSHFKSFFTEKSSVKKLRESILQLAVQGKLTKHWRSTKQLLPRKGEVPQAEGSNPALKLEVPKAEGSNPTLKPEVPQAEGSIDSPPFKEEYPPLAGEVVKKQLNNLPHLKTFRKELRKNLTPAEASLWKMLKGKQLDHRKFRRQHSVANYILDFYCPEEKLAIELDGDGHYEERQMEYDHERDLFLNHFGIRVLRFENKWVWQNTAGVLQAIRDAFGWLEKEPPRPPKADTPPLKGGEWIEHASVLLERIKAEKEALIKAKTIKKEKPLPDITEDEIPYDLPEGWILCRLGEVISLKSGQDLTPSEYSDQESFGLPYITGASNLLNEKVIINRWTNAPRSIAKKGDLLITCKGSGVGKMGWLHVEKAHIARQIMAIDTVCSPLNFIKVIMDVNAMIYRKNAIGLIPGIDRNTVLSTIVFFPPLEEQKAIVEKVNALMALCDTLEKEIETHQTTQERWMQSCLKEVFEK